MIVPMMRAAVVCLNKDKENALKQLREFGALHVEVDVNSEMSHTLQETKQRFEDAKIMLQTVSKLGKKAIVNKKTVKALKSLTIEEVFDNALKLIKDNNDITKELETLKSDHEQLVGWGDFQNQQLVDLEQRGIYVYLCSAHEKEYTELSNKYITQLVSFSKKGHKFAIISEDKLDIDELVLPVDNLPTKSLADVNCAIKNLRKELQINHDILASYDTRYEDLEFYNSEVSELIEFVTNEDAMGDNDAKNLSFIHGYVPKENVEELKKYALKHGWALQLEEPASDDRHVPTFLRVPKIFRISQPIFDFIGVSPGYRENDVSVCFLIFLTIFFAMIVGDAGYGALFLTTAITCKVLIKKPKAKLTINLAIVMSSATIIWGIMNANYFAIPEKYLPGIMTAPVQVIRTVPPWIQGDSAKNLTSKSNELKAKLAKASSTNSLTILAGLDENSNIDNDEIEKTEKKVASIKAELAKLFKDISQKNIQYFCFLLAAIHLSLGRIWGFCSTWKHSKRASVGFIGWAMFVWGNFFVAVNLVSYMGSLPSMLTYSLYAGGFTLMMTGLTKDDALNFPFAVIGSFVDVLSYIRLFAVGMAGFYIADNFNMMGGMLYATHWALIVPGIFVIFAGHVLNVTLALMGVLVHGIRLNTLEFSNHIGLQWLGHVYNPFRKKNKLK